MDTETENRILIFSELLKKIKDTEGPLTLFELSNLFDSCDESFDLIFHGIPGLPYNRIKGINRLKVVDYRVIPVVTETDSILEEVPNGISRFISNNGKVEIYDLVEKKPEGYAFKSRQYFLAEEELILKHTNDKGMEQEIQQRRNQLQEIFSQNQAAYLR